MAVAVSQGTLFGHHLPPSCSFLSTSGRLALLGTTSFNISSCSSLLIIIIIIIIVVVVVVVVVVSSHVLLSLPLNEHYHYLALSLIAPHSSFYKPSPLKNNSRGQSKVNSTAK
jgi:hypothetical protein